MIRYHYDFKNNKLNPLRLIILALGVLSDLVNIFMIASVFFDIKNLIYIAITFFVFLGLRISTLYLVYRVEYSYLEGEFSITKYYLDDKPHDLLRIKKSEIKSVEFYNGEEIDCIRFYEGDTKYREFVVELINGQKYILRLNNTMYVAISSEGLSDILG